MNKQTFLKTHALEEIPFREALQRLDRHSLFNDYDSEDGDHDEDWETVFFASSDVRIQGNFTIPDVYAWDTLIIVDGNLTVDGNMSKLYFVTGDATFDTLSMENCQRCLGTELVRFAQSQYAEDDGATNSSRPRHITAPLFFSWYFDISEHTFSEQTQVFALYDWDELKTVKPPKPLFAWSDYVYVLKPEFISHNLEEHWHNAPNWENRNMAEAVQQGKSIYIDGFDPSCMPIFRRGEDLLEEGDLHQAFLHFKKVTNLSPKYYPAYNLAGDCLKWQGAYLQAITYYEQGVRYMPVKDRTPEFYSASSNAYCLLRLGLTDAAIRQCESALQRHVSSPLCHKNLGEALLQLGNNQQALEALEKSVEIDNSFSAHWLCGLAHHRLDNPEQAKAHLEQAQAKNKIAKPYSEANDLSYFYTPATTVDWTEQGLDTYNAPIKGQAYWSEVFYRDLHSSNLDELCQRVPSEYRTLTMLEACISPSTHKGQALQTNGSVLKHFTHLPITHDIACKAVTASQRCEVSEIPSHLINKEVYLATNFLRISDVAEEFLDVEVCLHAIKQHCWNYKDIPQQLHTAEMAVQAIASGFLELSIADQMPTRYLHSDYLQQAIVIDISAIENIPAKLIDKSLFGFACTEYEANPLWQSVVDKHHPDTANTSDSPLDTVWACFWTDAFIESAVQAGIGLYKLPTQYITPKIAELAVKNSSYNFEYVPRELVTQKMSLLACSQDYGSAIEYVPIAMRTTSVCKNAVERDGSNLKFVPLEQRTVELCETAYTDHADNINAIPYEHYIKVFNILLKQCDPETYQGNLKVKRGIGHFAAESYQSAIKDFKRSRKDKSEISDAARLASFYYQGWAHYKLKQTWRSERCFAESQNSEDELEHTAPYADARLPNVLVSVSELDKSAFDQTMRQANALIDGHQYNDALLELERAESALSQSQCNEMFLWAQVWDYQRYCLYEAGQKLASVELCQQHLDTLKSVNLWDYLEHHNPIRHTIRTMSNQIAWHLMETGETLEDIEIGLEHISKAAEPPSPLEDDDVNYVFYDTYIELLIRACEFEPNYRVDLKRLFEGRIAQNFIRQKIINDDLLSRAQNVIKK